MIKKFLSVILCLCMIISMCALPQTAGATSTIDESGYNLGDGSTWTQTVGTDCTDPIRAFQTVEGGMGKAAGDTAVYFETTDGSAGHNYKGSSGKDGTFYLEFQTIAPLGSSNYVGISLGYYDTITNKDVYTSVDLFRLYNNKITILGTKVSDFTVTADRWYSIAIAIPNDGSTKIKVWINGMEYTREIETCYGVRHARLHLQATESYPGGVYYDNYRAYTSAKRTFDPAHNIPAKLVSNSDSVKVKGTTIQINPENITTAGQLAEALSAESANIRIYSDTTYETLLEGDDAITNDAMVVVGTKNGYSFERVLSYYDVRSKTMTNYDIIKEVAYAYDRQGAQIPYDQKNARRSIYSSPEDATAQRTIFLDCSSFVNSCYREAFGVNVLPYEIGQTGVSGTSPSTANYDLYAKNNAGAIDFVGYWEPSTYTDEQKQAAVDFIYENLQIGDVITYRHGATTSDQSGHVYMYMGDKTFIHCAGAGSYYVNSSNPALSYDRDAGEIKSEGTIGVIDASEIFEEPTSRRYIFRVTEDDTVWSFSMLRPMARGLTPTQETLARMEIAGLSMEKTSSVCENGAVDTGDILKYTVSLQNTNAYALYDVSIADVVPNGCVFVSGDSNVVHKDGKISWTGDVPAKKTVKVNYNVKVEADTAGYLIESKQTYVSGVKLGNITHSVSGHSKTQRALVGNAAVKMAEESKQFTDSIAMVKELYKSTLDIDLFDYTTAGAMLDDLIDTNGRTRYYTTELSKMIAPNMYGGLDIRYGWLYKETENDRTRLPKEEHLAVGDIIVADWSKGSTVYVYAGNKTLVTVEKGVCKELTIGDDIYSAGVNIIISLLGYDRYAVLRPAISGKASLIDVESIEIVSQPNKTSYGNEEAFNPDGMVVNATLNNGKTIEVKNYTVSPEIITYPMDSVNIEFGQFSIPVKISVFNEKQNTSVSAASNLSVGTTISVEGIVVGTGHEGLNNDSELLLKDVSNDTIISVRNIPYGSFPNFGYKKGDTIAFDATVMKDTSSSTCYSLKKYLSFSSDNGSIDETIISRGNEVTYNFDNVLEINSWDDMKSYFANKKLAPYTYVKLSPGVYFHLYKGTDTNNYRLHNNGSATSSSGIKVDSNAPINVRADVMTANLGANWKDILCDGKESTSYPGAYTNNGFYAFYYGGNNAYYQLAILEEDWIFDGEFYISSLSEDKKTATINVPEAGKYTVVFADYNEGKLENVDIQEITVKLSGKASVSMKKDFALGANDKVMLWKDSDNIMPMCAEYLIK